MTMKRNTRNSPSDVGGSQVEIENRVTTGRNGPIPVREYLPVNERPGALPFVWLHGGGFVSGGLDQKESDRVARSIASAGRRVLAVDYRLIPWWPLVGKFRLKPSENRHPVPLQDAEDAITDYASRTAGPLLVGGASAGAALAASATMRMRDAGMPLPRATVLAYGTFHAELPPIPPHLAQRLRGRYRWQFFTPKNTHKMHLNYAGSEEQLALPGTFPGGGDLHGLPPTLLLDADGDTLRASGEAFAAELTAAGVTATHRVIPDTGHGYLNKPGTRGFVEGTRRITEFLSRFDG
jgi:acetyl esterase